jgi:hypothetical protein
MTDDERNHEALFRHAILGDLLSRNLRRGQLRPALKQLAQQTYQDHHKRSRRVAYKTLEEWFSAEQIVLRSRTSFEGYFVLECHSPLRIIIPTYGLRIGRQERDELIRWTKMALAQ